MQSDLQYFKILITNMIKFFDSTRNKKFTNQTIETCLSLYYLCKNKNPDKVIEIGTNYGASTYALALAMKTLNKDLSCITSIDLEHGKWRDSFNIHKDLIKDYDLKVEKIKTITENFNKIEPENVVDFSKKVFIFYDMHDHEGPWSQRLLNLWIPLIKKGAVAIHDITPVNEDFEWAQVDIPLRTKCKYLNGQYYAGFNECERIINWANTNDIKIKNFDGGVYFII